MSASLYNRGLVALSADPVTVGHLDLIARAAKQCRSVVVLVANNDGKKGSYLFTLAERAAMIERAVADANIPNAKIVKSSNLLADVYLEEGCDAVFRGVRDEKDLEYEKSQMRLHADIFRPLADSVVYLDAREELRHVSSSMVKAFVDRHLDTSAYVPMFVKEALEERIHGQYKIAVTGGIAVGKTFVAETLARVAAKTFGCETYHVNVDSLIRAFYAERSNGAALVRARLAELFGDDVLTADRNDVNRPTLAARIFSPSCDQNMREEIHTITAPHVGRKYREALSGKHGLIVVEWAQLAEMGMGLWTNNNAIVVDSPDRAAFIARRGLDAAKFADIGRHQWSADRKVRALYACARRDRHGTVLRYANRLRENVAESERDIEVLVAEIATLFLMLTKKEGASCASATTM